MLIQLMSHSFASHFQLILLQIEIRKIPVVYQRFYFYFYSHRTTSNIAFDDVMNEFDDLHTVDISDDEMDGPTKENLRPIKRRRSSSTGDQLKIFESVAKALKDNQNQRMGMYQSTVEVPQTELELYFSSICKTVEKLPPIEQTKIKMQVSNIVNQAELAQLQPSQSTVAPYNYYNPMTVAPNTQPMYNSNSQNFDQTRNNFYSDSPQDTLVSAVCNMTNLH